MIGTTTIGTSATKSYRRRTHGFSFHDPSGQLLRSSQIMPSARCACGGSTNFPGPNHKRRPDLSPQTAWKKSLSAPATEAGRFENKASSGGSRNRGCNHAPLVSGQEANRYEVPDTSTFIIFPYRVEADGVSLLSRKEIVQDYPKAWNYLKRFEKKLRARESNGFDDQLGGDLAVTKI